jgi:hypothetical protein
MRARNPRAFCWSPLRTKTFSQQGGITVLVNFKTALAARGMRQIELALDLKVSPTVLSEIVNGRRSANPSLRARLAEVLQADEAWLFSSFTRIPKREDSATGASVHAACVGEPV